MRQHWESCPTALAKGEDFILYAILDFIVDNYMPVLEQIQDEVDEIEDRVLAKPMTERRHRAALHAAAATCFACATPPIRWSRCAGG